MALEPLLNDFEAVGITPTPGGDNHVSELTRKNQVSGAAEWSRPISSSGVSLGDKQKISKEDFLALLQQEKENENGCIINQPSEKSIEGKKISKGDLASEFEILLQRLEKEKNLSFMICMVNIETDPDSPSDSSLDKITVLRRYRIERIGEDLFYSVLVTSKENLERELTSFLGENKKADVNFIVSHGSDNGFVINGAALLIEEGNTTLGVLLKSDQQKEDTYNIRVVGDKTLITVETLFDAFIPSVGSTNQIWLEESEVKTSVTYEVKTDADETTVLLVDKSNTLSESVDEIHRLAIADLAGQDHRQTDALSVARHVRLGFLAAYIKEKKPYIDKKFEADISQLCHATNWLTPAERKRLKIENNDAINFIENYLLVQLLNSPKNEETRKPLLNELEQSGRRGAGFPPVQFTPANSNRIRKISATRLRQKLSPALYKYFIQLLNHEGILYLANDPVFNKLAATFRKNLKAMGFSFRPDEVISVRQLAHNKLELQIVSSVKNKNGDVLFEKSFKVEFEDNNTPGEENPEKISHRVLENQYTKNNMHALKERFRFSQKVTDFQKKLSALLAKKEIIPQKEKTDLEKTAGTLFNKEEHPEIFHYMASVFMQLDDDNDVKKILSCYEIKENPSKTGVSLECNLTEVTNENILKKIALQGFTLKSQLEAAKILRKKNPGKLFKNKLPKNEPVAIALALIEIAPEDISGERNLLLEAFQHGAKRTSPTTLEEKFFCLDVLSKVKPKPKAKDEPTTDEIFAASRAKIIEAYQVFFLTGFLNTPHYPDWSDANLDYYFNQACSQIGLLLALNQDNFHLFDIYDKKKPEIFFKDLCIQLDLVSFTEEEKNTMEYVKLIQDRIKETAASTKHWLTQMGASLKTHPGYKENTELKSKNEFLNDMILKTAVFIPEEEFFNSPQKIQENSPKEQKKRFDAMLLDTTQHATLVRQALDEQDPNGARKYLEETSHPGIFRRAARKLFWWTNWSKTATKLSESAKKIMSEPVVKIAFVQSSVETTKKPDSAVAITSSLLGSANSPRVSFEQTPGNPVVVPPKEKQEFNAPTAAPYVTPGNVEPVVIKPTKTSLDIPVPPEDRRDALFASGDSPTLVTRALALSAGASSTPSPRSPHSEEIDKATGEYVTVSRGASAHHLEKVEQTAEQLQEKVAQYAEKHGGNIVAALPAETEEGQVLPVANQDQRVPQAPRFGSTGI